VTESSNTAQDFWFRGESAAAEDRLRTTVDALVRARRLQVLVDHAFAGLALGLALATVVGLLALTARRRRGGELGPLALAFFIALGIGLHNMGEGLAIGSALATGAIGLGTFLVVAVSAFALVSTERVAASRPVEFVVRMVTSRRSGLLLRLTRSFGSSPLSTKPVVFTAVMTPFAALKLNPDVLSGSARASASRSFWATLTCVSDPVDVYCTVCWSSVSR